MYATFEGLSGFGYNIGAGLGETEYSITAYPGICVFDKECWGNPRGHLYQWFRTSDTGWRASQIYGEEPEEWDFTKHEAADIVVICIGTNDANAHNNVTAEGYAAQYTMFIAGIHAVWPDAQIVLVVSPALLYTFRSTKLTRVVSLEGVQRSWKHLQGKWWLRIRNLLHVPVLQYSHIPLQ